MNLQAPSGVILDAKTIAQILPHRYPILLVDRIIHLDLNENIIVGQKNVTMNEHFFVGHFPEAPIMPGVLILEALAQTGGILVHQKLQTDKIAVLLTVNNAKFRKPVVPGDVLYLHITGQHISSKGGKVAAKALVGENVVVEAEIGFALIDRKGL
jgi:3-hydroxyacyl-[acyl-carrier-protein] dehydratase